MITEDLKSLDDLGVYDYLVNNLDNLAEEDVVKIVDRLASTDLNGQWLTSVARYLTATDRLRFKTDIDRLVTLVIERDREHRYLRDLIVAIYGDDYAEHIEEYNSDDNFRRIYKRLHPAGVI